LSEREERKTCEEAEKDEKKPGSWAGASRSLRAYLPDRLSKCDRAESLEETQVLDRLSV
jgi:hypothetical protein